MNREVHVRFWESLEVKVLRATRPVPSSVYITTCPQLAKAAVRAADEGAGFDPKRSSGPRCSVTTAGLAQGHHWAPKHEI
jgi:hypothetical protein